MTSQLFPKPPKRMRQPRKETLREELARAADEIERLAGENQALRQLVSRSHDADAQACVQCLICTGEWAKAGEFVGLNLYSVVRPLDVDLSDPRPAGGVDLDGHHDLGLVERCATAAGIDSNKIGHRGASCKESIRYSSMGPAPGKHPWWRRLVKRKAA